MRSSHETACQVILERGALAGPGGYTKVSQHTPGVLDPNSKKLWLIKKKPCKNGHTDFLVIIAKYAF